MEGVPVPIIQQQLGHTSLATTDRYVSHLAPVNLISHMQQRDWTVENTSNPAANHALIGAASSGGRCLEQRTSRRVSAREYGNDDRQARNREECSDDDGVSAWFVPGLGSPRWPD